MQGNLQPKKENKRNTNKYLGQKKKERMSDCLQLEAYIYV
jgi:hypothetical protein